MSRSERDCDARLVGAELCALVWICGWLSIASACTSLRDGEPDSDAGSGVGGRKDAGASRPGEDGGGGAQGQNDRDAGEDGGPVDLGQPTPCELDPAACPACDEDDDCVSTNPCRTTRCDLELGRCATVPRKDGIRCPLGADEDGVCAEGQCAQCVEDDDCAPTQLTCRRSYCTEDHACSTRPRAAGGACEGGGFCNEDAQCVECALDENCGANGACVDDRCGCQPGFAPNSAGPRACNFDECALEDDNRCGREGLGSRCTNTDDGYSCQCDAPWKAGDTDLGPQCFQGGAGATMTVPNGATWNAVLTPTVICPNLFAQPPLAECPRDAEGKLINAQLTWLNLCGGYPPPCVAMTADGTALGTSARLQLANYSAALEDYGDPAPDWVKKIEPINPGDVILVDTVTALGVMRIVSVDLELKFEWATLWRDHCFLPGGASCLAECDCEGGS